MCVTSGVAQFLLTMSRVTAGALLPSITCCILSKCYATRYFLHHSWLALVVSFEPAHNLHTCKLCLNVGVVVVQVCDTWRVTSGCVFFSIQSATEACGGRLMGGNFTWCSYAPVTRGTPLGVSIFQFRSSCLKQLRDAQQLLLFPVSVFFLFELTAGLTSPSFCRQSLLVCTTAAVLAKNNFAMRCAIVVILSFLQHHLAQTAAMIGDE